MSTLDELSAAGIASADPQLRARFNHDFFNSGASPELVLAPRSLAEAREAIQAAAASGLAVVPRGGGMSYTGGYVAAGQQRFALVDLRGLTAIDLSSADDGIVVVEAGVTWHQLWEVLKARGLRANFWGPLSGLTATVGGGLSQNAIFWGSGQTATAGDAARGFEIALPDGEILRTGVLARSAERTGVRHFGPDLTQLFVGDAGRFGVKLRIALAVMPLPQATGGLSFSFAAPEALLAAMGDIARAGLAAQQVGFDPVLANLRSRRQSLGEDFKTLTRLLRGQGSILKGLRDAAGVTLAGRGFLEGAGFTLHAMCEARSERSLRELLAEVTDIAGRHGGTGIENTIPTVMAAAPFTPLNGVIGPNGERWVPVHGLFQASRAAAAYRNYLDTLDVHREIMERLSISSAALFSAAGPGVIVIEPMFFWPDALEELHRETLEEKVMKRTKPVPANPEARDAVAALRRAVVDAWAPLDPGHLQVGRSYPFAQRLDSTQRRLFEGIAALVDPLGRSNPGALGLECPRGAP
ncbi:MAG: FAD-binding oxidoreductase [Steroidobacteraceae bacterium]|jgi:FAD/FMN-containing dehydrogenase|nr:FAD-binding oxidoreductase [Steroidobacteraceae bacterium]MCC7200615.1 FAD-binding oxidoreductase [Gammaproteobacteria bacterium]